MALDQTPEGLYLLPSAQKHADGTPRFTLSLPPSYNADPGLSLLAKLEAEHAGFEFTTRAFFDGHLQAGDIFLMSARISVSTRWARQRVCRARSV